MLEAFGAMLLGSALARWVLWPLEMKLERRRFKKLANEMRDYMKEEKP